MVFSSHVFIHYYLPLVLASYFLIPGRWRNLHLTLVSYVFYGWWNPWFVGLMFLCSLIDYLGGGYIGRHRGDRRRQRIVLAMSLTANLGLLAYFKYGAFLAENLRLLVPAMPLAALDVVLPVGISFYTFQSMSYTIDVYRGETDPADSFVDFAAYVALFPQLVAGPIVRYTDIAAELRRRTHSLERLAHGLARLSIGFAKKLLLADSAGVVADAVFAADAPSWHAAWIGVIAYAFQIYFDFSGYSDMAIGLGHTIGFTFLENFESPYRAQSITDFWRRWHISLSTWLRDYLYIPLGGNRKGPGRTYANLMATMLLGGLWHGASWSFVVWGGLHGLMLALERRLHVSKDSSGWLRVPRIAATFVALLVTWVFFRATTLAAALRYLGCMFGLVAPTAASTLVEAEVYAPWPLAALLACAVVVWLMPRAEAWVVRPLTWSRALVCILLFTLALVEMSFQSHRPFLYFQF